MTFLRRSASYNYMQSIGPIRFILYSSLASAALLSAQSVPTSQFKPSATVPAASTLPPTPPTIEPTVPLTPSQQQPKRAQVTLVNGSLSVSADNSSLNQILRQISHDTGIKITGGVMDERVFGQYGPAAPDQILAELLDGTGSNMLFVKHDGNAAPELILTPRQGGPTPPNPNAVASDDKNESDDSQSQPAPEPQPAAEAVPDRNRTVPPIVPAAPGASTPADGSQPDSPNGVKTPQQIYEQLQHLRQQTPPQ
ncbi:hypothetical protein RBB77_16925 [Tunturibacter psychrotolerans]|uniref:Secretin/TonB short N-terminal domain-containing protein n=1 Tax=Tunturiibacter psychrotolerans TaxID=3069686 RepID=A0AAU7ZLN8_9BACT